MKWLCYEVVVFELVVSNGSPIGNEMFHTMHSVGVRGWVSGREGGRGSLLPKPSSG